MKLFIIFLHLYQLSYGVNADRLISQVPITGYFAREKVSKGFDSHNIFIEIYVSALAVSGQHNTNIRF